MFTLSLSVLFSIAVNVFTLGKRVQEHSKCLSTLKDIQEAYLRGDYYPTDVENSVFDLHIIHRYQRGVAITSGFYIVPKLENRNCSTNSGITCEQKGLSKSKMVYPLISTCLCAKNKGKRVRYE